MHTVQLIRTWYTKTLTKTMPTHTKRFNVGRTHRKTQNEWIIWIFYYYYYFFSRTKLILYHDLMAAGRTRILFHCPHASAHIAHSSMEKSKHETKEGEKNCDDMESDVTINE